MLAPLAFALIQQTPVYKMQAIPLDPDNGPVEVACISPNGNIAANQGGNDAGENKYNADDNIGSSHPVLIIHGQPIRVNSKLDLEARGINDKGQAVLFERATLHTFLYDRGKLTELKFTFRDPIYFDPVGIDTGGDVAGIGYPIHGEHTVGKAFVREAEYGSLGTTFDLTAFRAIKEESEKPIEIGGLPTLETQTWFLGPFGVEAPTTIDVGYGTHERGGDGPRIVDEYALYRNTNGIVPLINLVKNPLPNATLQEGGRINYEETIAASGYVKSTPAVFILNPIKRSNTFPTNTNPEPRPPSQSAKY